jgi:hypothetical protein
MSGESLRERLLATGKSRWLDVGNGGRLDEGFEFIDTYPVELLSSNLQNRYFRMSIVDPPPNFTERLGKFDLVRAQHVVEHLSYEDGRRFVENCAKLMSSGSVLLVTVPDLRRHIDWYLAGYREQHRFRAWASSRVPSDAPPSMFFSVFAHSLPFEPHKWCYDDLGLIYQIDRTQLFKDIVVLPVDDPLAETPFTHNRPDEDLCVVAIRK